MLYTASIRGLALTLCLVSMATFITVIIQNQSLSKRTLTKLLSSTEYTWVFPPKWIVTTSMTKTSPVALTGWVILLYDSRSSPFCIYPQCIELGDWQPHNVLREDIGRDVTTANRKSSAYLFAISHGATFICAVDELASDLEWKLSRFVYTGQTTGVVPNTNLSFVHAESFFVQRSDFVNSELKDFQFDISDTIKPVIQLFANIDMRGMDHVNQLFPIFLQSSTFTSLAGDEVLFNYDAFWSMIFTDMRNGLGDIILQKLIWIYGGSVGVYPHINNVYKRDTPVLHISNIESWICKRGTFLNCIEQLIQFCHEENIISDIEKNTVETYLNELENIGYMFPRRLSPQDMLAPSEKSTGFLRVPSLPRLGEDSAIRNLRKACPNTTIDFSVRSMDDIGLIISFNHVGYYDNIPLLEAMYRPYFKHILICGPDVTAFKEISRNSTNGYFIFIEGFKFRWLFMYDCTVQAMKLNLDVKGFLQIGDDTIINPWNMYNLPREKIWLHNGTRRIPVSSQDFKWGFWKSGRRRVVELINKLRRYSMFKQTPNFVRTFLNIFRSNSANFQYVFVSGCDFMYMPSHLKESFTDVANIFTEKRIMLEAGYANMVMGLQTLDKIHSVQDGNLWNADRYKWPSVYSPDLVFMHPFKLKSNLHTEIGRKIICDDYFLKKKPKL